MVRETLAGALLRGQGDPVGSIVAAVLFAAASQPVASPLEALGREIPRGAGRWCSSRWSFLFLAMRGSQRVAPACDDETHSSTADFLSNQVVLGNHADFLLAAAGRGRLSQRVGLLHTIALEEGSDARGRVLPASRGAAHFQHDLTVAVDLAVARGHGVSRDFFRTGGTARVFGGVMDIVIGNQF